MRTRSHLFALALAIVGAACSGDDGGTPAIDARPPDAPMCMPVNDGNECTTDECVNNMPVNTPRTGMSCTGGGTCNAQNMCVPPASCTDGMMNGNETGVDCGGSCVGMGLTCPAGMGCMVPADCATGVCSGTPMTCQAARCGDGVMQAGEMCDDGNGVNGDGCDDGTGGTCRPTGCGNGTVTSMEVCDDGNATNGDGCDNNCTTTACGNGVVTMNEMCDDGDTMGSDGCSATCQNEAGFTCNMAVPNVCTPICGDGVIVTGEMCDQGMGNVMAGDGCGATCQVEAGWACTGTPSACGPVCGDNMMIAPETCDDGNTNAFDGCSQTCRTERSELEPNEDGTPQPGGPSGIAGNDFDTAVAPAISVAAMNATTNGNTLVSSGSVNWRASLSVGAAPGTPGDEDVYAINNDTNAPVEVRLDTWNRAMGTGLGVPCADAQMVDTGITIRNAQGTSLGSNDDRNGGLDRCSGIGFVLPAMTTVYAHVTEYSDDLVIAGYGLQVAIIPIVCGDNRTVAGVEQCDDGNTASNDGCSSTCQFDVGCPTGQNLVTVANTTATPIPDNDTVTGVTIPAVVGTAGAVASVRVAIGDLTHTNNADVDLFLRAPNGAQRELSTDNGGTGDNYTNVLFTDAALTSITTAATTAAITGPFRPEQSLGTTAGVDFRATNAAGTWNLRAFDDLATNTGSLNAWTLHVCVDPTATYCGDTIRNGTEECDDGNTVDNDACSNLCQVVDGCGDGNIDAGEACDDNNLAPGDGCSATCALDIGCAAGETAVIVANTTSTPMVDNNTGILSSTAVATAGLVRRAIVTVNVTHATTAQVDIWLQSPFGGQRILSDDQAGTNYIATTFADTAATAITSQTTGAHSGTFRPENTLAGFNGQSAAGNWLLRVGDDTVGTTGTLDNWTLALCVDTATTATCGNGVVEAAERCDDGATVAGDGCSATCQLELNCTAGQTEVVLRSTDGPVQVLDNTPAGSLSLIAVTAPGAVAKAVVVVNALGHTFDGDLNLTLASPMATTLDLSSGNGSGGDDYLSTHLDDGAATAITAGATPFRGRFRPEGAGGLATFNTQTAAGMWQLRMVDTFNGDAGTLTSWTLGLCVQ